MLRMMRLTPPPAKLGILLTGTVCLALLATDAAAQPTREPEVVGAAGTVSPIVVSLDRSLTFYQGTLGLKSDAIREASAKETPPPLILTLEGTPEGRMRWSHVTFPGTMWWAEPLEFGDVERKAAQPRIQDPGAVTLIFAVRDLDSILAKVKKAGTPVVTPGGLPVRVEAGGTKGRAILVKDPDDHFIELIQPRLLDGEIRAPGRPQRDQRVAPRQVDQVAAPAIQGRFDRRKRCGHKMRPRRLVKPNEYHTCGCPPAARSRRADGS